MMNKSILGDAQRRAKWQAEQDRFTQSGLSVEQWCLREGVAKSAFYMRRSRLKLNAAKLKTNGLGASVKHGNAVAMRPTFIDAGVLGTNAHVARAVAMPPNNGTGTEVRIDLGGGVVITVTKAASTLLTGLQ